MALWKNTQHSFASGQLDALVMGRQDLEKYYSGATLLRNFLVKKQGCVSKRRGTDLVADLGGLNGNDADGNPIGENAMRLVPVADSADEGRYIIISGGVAYTANKDGVLMSDGNRVRKIDEYAAKNDEGRRVSNVGGDDEADDENPITVLHRLSAGRYRRTRFTQKNIQEALDKTEDGDRVVLHGDLLFMDDERPEFRSETFDISDGVASTFAFSDGYWRMTRNGATYAATSSGRTVYDPQFKIGTVTATRTWTYAADGGHKNRSYKASREANSYWWKITATDTAQGDAESVTFAPTEGDSFTATRTGGSAAWSFSDGIAWTMAFANGGWSASRAEQVTATTTGAQADLTVSFTADGVTVTATRTSTSADWTFSDGNAWTLTFASSTWTATRTKTITASQTAATLNFVIDDATIAATRTGATSAWSFSDSLAWTLSNSNGAWTATRTVGSARQSDGANKESNYLASTVTATVDGETVVATNAWKYSDGGAWTPRTSTWLYFDCDGYVTQRATTYWGVDSFTFDKVVNATRKAKQVEFDLNGYDVRFVGRSYFFAQTPNVGVTFKTSRRNARVMVTSNSNCHAMNLGLWSSSIGSSRLGGFAFESGIEWQMNGGSANVLIDIRYAKSVTFNGGTFRDTSENADAQANMFCCADCGSVTVNGGTYDCGLDTGFLRAFSFSNTTVVVNGGEFINKRAYSKDGGSVIFEFRSGAKCTINGGRFDCTGNNFSYQPIGARGETFFETYVTLVRGEFSFSEMPCWSNKHVHPLIDFCHEGSVANAETHDGYSGVKVAGEMDYKWKERRVDVIPYRVVVPYADADIRDLCARQCGDTVFVVHPSYPPAKFWFDEQGELHYEELAFDNTDVYPPVIDAAVMQGQDPKATTRPEEDPSWLSTEQQAELDEFYATHSAEGTMTDAGFSGNEAKGTDGTSNSACTYTATVVIKDAASGKKTTKTCALSFTKTVTKEVTTTYTDGSATGSTDKLITTSGSAQNDASAAVVMVPRTIRYVATYVKDGRESLPSAPVEIDYEMPWANNAVVNITVSKGRNDEEPDYYNLYKDNGSGYGLVGTTNAETYAGGYAVSSLDPYAAYAPILSASSGVTLVSVAELCEKKGWPVSSFMKRLASAPTDYPSSLDGDVGIVLPQSMKDDGIDLPTDASVLEIFLDARVKDAASGSTVLVVSQVAAKVHVEFTMKNEDGIEESGTATATYYPDVTTIHGAYSATVGVPKLMCALEQKTYTLASGEKFLALNLGTGDQSKALEKCVRSILFPNPLAGQKGVTVNRVYVTFDYFYGWDIWSNYRYQGAIHAIRAYEKAPRSMANTTWTTKWNGYTRTSSNSVVLVYSVARVKDEWGDWVDKDNSVTYGVAGGTSGSSVGGNFQDDYITPDMTVTPPVEPKEAHFAAEGGYPRTVGLHNQRLVLASTGSSPSTVWFSRTGDLYSFEPHESVREDDAMELTLAATELPDINHLVDGRELLLLADGGEWTISPISGNALTYKTAQMKLQSSIGSDRTLQPMQIAGEVLFAERGGGGLRAMQYAYGSDSYQSVDLTLPAQSVFLGSRIVSMCYKQRPDSVVECVLADGRVAALVYDKENEVVAWSVHDFGNGWLARQIATPKSVTNGTTETMLLVQNAGGEWQMWKVRDDDPAMTAAKQVVLDGLHVEKDGAEVAEGEVVVDLGDGTSAHGIPVVSEMVTVRPEAKQGDTLQMELKNATECEVRVANGSTFEMKPYAAKDGWRETALEPGRDGTKVTLGEADAKRLMTGLNTRDGRIHLRHSAPWPISILSVSTTYQVEYENGGQK